MLKRESNILSKLNHPNIVRMKMSKETFSKIYIVMDYVDGISL
jgi:serine/threonine protein kinase